MTPRTTTAAGPAPGPAVESAAGAAADPAHGSALDSAHSSALDSDAAELRARLAAGERRLAALPEPAARTGPDREAAGRLHAEARALRHRFLTAHTEAVYDRLTDGRAERPRLEALAERAAERFPGLVPSPDQLRAERARPQADREGREIDHGILFRALLRSPAAGAHLMESMRQPTPRALGLLPEYRRTGEVALGTVRLARHGGAAHVTLHNDDCLNAEDETFLADLETAVDLVLLDPLSRVGVLRGGVMTHPRYAGRRVFCAGINLKKLHAGEISLIRFLLGRELGCLAKLVHGLLTDPAPDAFPYGGAHKPWIGAVDAFAIGGGLQLLLALDWVIAADDAYVSLPAGQEGIVPGSANLRLGRFGGARLNRRILFGGLKIRATDPDAALFCDETVPAERIEERIDSAVAALDNPAVAANRRMLVLAEEPLSALRAYLAEFAYVQAERIHSPDVLAKVRAFDSGARTAAPEAG